MLLEVFWVVLKQWLKYLTEERHKSPNVEDAMGMLARNLDSEDYHVLLNKWLNLKNENLRLQHDLVQSREENEELAEELAAVHEKNESLEQEGVTQEVLQRAAVSNKPKVVHQCNNMKLRQEVLKHGCAAGTRKETDRCIINCVRPSKKQHRMCSWFCGKVGHKKVKCFAREKSRNMTKKVNEETSGEGCSSVESNLEVDQEASNLELGHEVVCGTKEKEIERALGVDGEGLMVKKMTHDGSKVLNISWSKGSSTGASGHDAILGENGDVLVQSMHISWGRKSWCGAHLVGEKSTFCVEVSSAMRRALDLTLAEKKMNLAEWALNCYKKGMLDQIVDPFLKGKITPECFKKFAEINRYEMCTRPGHRETVYGRCSVELRVRVAASGKRGREREGDMDAMRRALDLTLAEKKMNLAEWALNCYKKGMLDQIVDPFLKGKITPECFKKFAEINRYEMCTRPGHRETVYGRCSVELRVRVAASGKRGREREGDME
ncbi:hypothetical protein DY000_02017996 [Brassica cretica]|uniref:Uncharacterized protein n=1 Tax=Brassica cretica TaxID=69181 RepID=A0ABQ7CXE5_BRACR|nr:hypothetical protein DY000_02017996 [Brassica cretica]